MKSKLIFIVAIVMGIITTALFFQYMKKFDQQAIMEENMVDVVAVSKTIPPNRRITSDMLQIVTVPKMSVHEHTIYEIEDAVGKYTTAQIEANEVLLKHHIQSEKEETIFVSKKVKEGYRAVSVGVNFVQSVSNLIEPEDYVDVIFSEVIKLENNQTRVDSKQLLSNVRVLAVGRRLVDSTKTEEPYVEYSSVTLELKPADAVKLVNASERGSIQLTLHTKISSSEKKQ